MGYTYKAYATRMGFTTVYNAPVTKDRDNQQEHKNKFPVAFCPVCKQAFDRRLANGKGNKTNRLLKPAYLDSNYPTYKLDRELCGVNKCHNKQKEPKGELK